MTRIYPSERIRRHARCELQQTGRLSRSGPVNRAGPTPDLASLGRGRWYELPDGHGLFRVGVVITPIPGPAGVITAGPLHAAGVTVTGVDTGERDPALATGPWRGREAAQATARTGFTTAGTAERRQVPVRIGDTLAMAAAAGAPVRVAGQLTGQLAVAAQDDLAGQFTRERTAAATRTGPRRAGPLSAG